METIRKSLQRGYQKNMKALIDTNILLDFYCERARVREAEDILRMACTRFTGLLMASQIKDLSYILRKENQNEVKFFLKDLLDSLQIIDLTRSDVYQALNCKMTDVEDAMLSYSARRHKADYIISWNISDFSMSPVKAITPTEFIERMSK